MDHTMNRALSSALTRREFLGAVGAFSVGLGFGAAPSAQAASGEKIPVGLQLYSVRDQCKNDLPGTVAAVAKIGYRGVEFAGYHGRSAKELRKLLDDNGLVACGTHTPYESVLGDKLKATIEFNQTIGNKFLIVPWMNETQSKQVWLDRAKLFNELADQVKADGMWVGYHAHAHDFKEMDGVSAWDLFFGNTKAEVVMQLDTSNCCDGGADPVAVLKKYPGRARSIHIKAHGGGPEAVIGEDKVNWAEVFAFCETKGNTQWYVVEHESGKDPLDAVQRCYEALKKMGKV
jgi:sugar phosphate isomerase/epimerase